MNTITSPVGSAQTISAGTPPTAAPSSNALESDFETFLVMLTTQLQNQDPLNPLDSTDFAVQLATFSGVEQQVRTNDLLADMIKGLSASGVAQLAGWVGMEAKVDAPVMFDGSPIELAPTPDPAAESAVLVVKDGFGQVVSREVLPPTDDTLFWAGTDSNGQPLPAGTYSFELESIAGEDVLSTRPVPHYALITEAQASSSGTQVVTSTGAIVLADSVTALRQPASEA